MDIFKLGDKILALLEAVFGFWNNQISLVFAMLGQSPVSFKGGGPWAVIEGIEPVFVAVGSSLVVLFFVIGFCSESIDVKDEMRFESILRMLIRLGLAEWFVANNVTIMKAFFTSIGNLVGLISAGTTTQLAIDSTQADIIKGLGFGESLVMLILTALLAIIIIICGFFIIYTVYFRFLKILIIVPLGAIACSTMAGNRMVSHTMATYCKYFLSCVFEAVTMALAIVVCNAFINAGLPAFTGSYADWAQTLIYVIVEPSEIRGHSLSNRSDFMPEDIQTLNKGCVRFKSGYIPGESEIREAMDRAMIMQLNLLPVARKMVLEELEMKQNG